LTAPTNWTLASKSNVRNELLRAELVSHQYFDTYARWIRVDPTSGHVSPRASSEFISHFDSELRASASWIA